MKEHPVLIWEEGVPTSSSDFGGGGGTPSSPDGEPQYNPDWGVPPSIPDRGPPLTRWGTPRWLDGVPPPRNVDRQTPGVF